MVIPSLAETFAPLALLLPLGGAGADLSVPGHAIAAHEAALVETMSADPSPATASPAKVLPVRAGATPKLSEAVEFPVSGRPAALDSLKVVVRQAGRQGEGQIRIEQRVFVRITPRTVSSRRNLLAQLPVRPQVRRYEESKPEKCVRVEEIAGVETGSGNRLLLFLRDTGLLSVNLEKSCRARDFYAGFYVERNDDGKLCVERDTLQSRNGARCDIARMMQIKAIED